MTDAVLNVALVLALLLCAALFLLGHAIITPIDKLKLPPSRH